MASRVDASLLRVYRVPVTANSVIQDWRSVKYRRMQSRYKRFFCVRCMATPFMGGPCVGAFGLTGSCTRHANPHGSAHPYWRMGAVMIDVQEIRHAISPSHSVPL